MRKAYRFLLLATIATTLLSWFNVNSWLIIGLVAYRLAEGGRPFHRLRTAFSNRYFLAYFSLFLIEVLGLLYTHDAYTAYKHVESKATLVAVPFVFCSGEFCDREGFRRLMKEYCWLLAAIGSFCLAVAVWRYVREGYVGVFFYHALTEVVGVNAVFFSAFILIALLFLLSPAGRGRGRTALIIFFTAMMILLASKLLLVMQVIIFLACLKDWGRMRLQTGQWFGLTALVILGTGALAVTKNPVEYRYREILHDDWQYTGLHTVPSHAAFNGVSLRLLIWQFAVEILDEQQAWWLGVSAGDSQDLLNRKYLAANMSPGFLGYNFHNQYIEILVRNGILGLCVWLAALGILLGLARRTATLEGWWVLAILLLLALTESTLEMQHSLFLFCFFPLLFSYGGMNRTNE